MGLSLYYSDSAAALSIDGERIHAVQEERFANKKQVSNFPDEAVKHCLLSNKLILNDIAQIICYEKPLLTLKRMNATCIGADHRGRRSLFAAMQVWLKEKFFLKSEIKNQSRDLQQKLQETEEESFNLPEFFFSELHLTHPILAFYPSPIQEAAIVCMD